MDIEELKRLREAVEWYRDEALALSINLAGKNDQAVLAGVTALSLDAGQRGIKASVALQAIIARLEAAQRLRRTIGDYIETPRPETDLALAAAIAAFDKEQK